jgi:hypothetical protein
MRHGRKVGGVALAVLILAAGRAFAGQAVPTDSIDERVRKDVLEALARELDARYAIPDMGKKLATTIKAKQRANAYKSITSGPEFARVLTDDLSTVAHDKHLHVNFSFTPLPQQGPRGLPPELRKMNGGISEVRILDGNVGYMKLYGVLPLELARGPVTAAFAFLHNTDALIIDNRSNGGGDPNTVALYVSYLSEGAPYVVNTFHWREGNRVEEFKTTDLGDLTYGSKKPVFVLTGQGTFSGGEELSYDLQVLKRALVVGEVTGGGANPGGPVPLGHQFVVNIPSGQAINPVTGTSWEGVGVKPDIAVPTVAALGQAHRLAIERLSAATADPLSRSMLDAVAMKLEAIEQAESGSVSRLANVELLGDYAPTVGRGTTVHILEKDGRLVRHVDGLTDRELVYLNGNRYRPEGLPEGFAISFRTHQGKTELLLEEPIGPSTIRVKQ